VSEFQRLSQSFADDIALYDRVRPEYPPSLIERLFLEIGDCQDRPAIEVGPGTGKLTRHLLAHGLDVTCFEPAKGFVRFLQREFESQGSLNIVCERFEDSNPRPGEYDLVTSGQAFHWVTPLSRGLDMAAGCLRKNGVLALAWYCSSLLDIGTKRAIKALYEDYSQVSAFLPGSGPSSRIDYVEQLEACTAMGDVSKETFREEISFNSEEVGERLSTESQHKKLEDAARERLIDDVRSLIVHNGDSVEVAYDFSLYLCRKL